MGRNKSKVFFTRTLLSGSRNEETGKRNVALQPSELRFHARGPPLFFKSSSEIFSPTEVESMSRPGVEAGVGLEGSREKCDPSLTD